MARDGEGGGSVAKDGRMEGEVTHSRNVKGRPSSLVLCMLSP